MCGGGKIRRLRPDCQHLGLPQQQANPISKLCKERHMFPATASAEGAQFNVPPFPATASAEGAQLNGRPSPYDDCCLCCMFSAISNSALARFTTGTSTTLPSNEVDPFPARSASSKAATTRLACSISSGDGEKVALMMSSWEG